MAKADAKPAPVRTYEIDQEEVFSRESGDGSSEVTAWVPVGNISARNHADALRKFGGVEGVRYRIVTASSSQTKRVTTKTTTTVTDA